MFSNIGNISTEIIVTLRPDSDVSMRRGLLEYEMFMLRLGEWAVAGQAKGVEPGERVLDRVRRCATIQR